MLFESIFWILLFVDLLCIAKQIAEIEQRQKKILKMLKIKKGDGEKICKK